MDPLLLSMTAWQREGRHTADKSLSEVKVQFSPLFFQCSKQVVRVSKKMSSIFSKQAQTRSIGLRSGLFGSQKLNPWMLAWAAFHAFAQFPMWQVAPCSWNINLSWCSSVSCWHIQQSFSPKSPCKRFVWPRLRSFQMGRNYPPKNNPNSSQRIMI